MRSYPGALVLAGGLLLAAAAAAQPATAPNAVPLSTQQARSFTLRNATGQPIVEAEATMTDRTQHALTASGPIAPRQGRDIAVPANQCLAAISVTLKDGKAFRSDNLHDCGVTHITVSDHGIDIGTSAAGLDKKPRNALAPASGAVRP